jgi:hypothetical protein
LDEKAKNEGDEVQCSMRASKEVRVLFSGASAERNSLGVVSFNMRSKAAETHRQSPAQAQQGDQRDARDDYKRLNKASASSTGAEQARAQHVPKQTSAHCLNSV